MAVSIKDVAARAGVSRCTVSHVLNGNTKAGIALATQERVRRAAEELHYQPNIMARGLARRRTDTIGLMLSELRNPFFLEVFKQFERMVIESGYQILLDTSTAGYGQYHELRRSSGWFVDGVLIWALPHDHLRNYLGERARDMPVCYLGHLREDGADAVAMDLYGAGKQIMEHLLARGYRRPCFISTYPAGDFLLPAHQNPGFQNNQFPAIRDVCRAAGIEVEILVLENRENRQEDSFQLGLQIAKRPPSERPDSLICINDWIAHFVALGLQRGGIQVPRDIAIAGFDGISEGKYLANGPLTTVTVPVDLLCRTALNILMKRIPGDTATPPEQILIPMQLTVGGTT